MSKGKVIHGFQERRRLETALQELSRLQDDEQRLLRAQELARHGRALLPLILRHLGTDDPLLRGALGLVLSYMPRELIAPKLREVAANPQRSDQERMTALMFLERFLDEPVEESLYAQLRNPNAVIEQSLREVIQHQDDIPDIVVDYLTQLQEEPVDVALMVMDAISRMGEENVFPLLAMLAQDVRPDVATAAVRLLERSSHPQRAAVLSFLAETAFGDVQTLAERSVRKMRMRGLNVDAPAQAHWRALVTAPDMHGSQAIWLVRQVDGEQRLLGFLANAEVGVQFAFVLDDVPPDLVPALEVGRMLPIVMGEDANDPDSLAWFLEVALGHVRRWVQEFVHQNYISEYQLPVLFRRHIFTFWAETAHAGIAEAPSLPQAELDALPRVLDLFQHPTLARWYVEPPRDAFAERRWLRSGLDEKAFARALDGMDESAFPESLWLTIGEHLYRLAEWFLLAEEGELAAHAVTAAYALEHLPYGKNVFAQMLVARGLAITFSRLQQARDQWDE